MVKAPKEYRALVGMNYPHPEKEGEEVRVEAGDKLTILPDDKWVAHHERVGNIAVWKAKQTEKVKDESENVAEVYGVMSRHYDGAIVLRQVGSE